MKVLGDQAYTSGTTRVDGEQSNMRPFGLVAWAQTKLQWCSMAAEGYAH